MTNLFLMVLRIAVATNYTYVTDTNHPITTVVDGKTNVHYWFVQEIPKSYTTNYIVGFRDGTNDFELLVVDAAYARRRFKVTEWGVMREDK